LTDCILTDEYFVNTNVTTRIKIVSLH